MKSFVTFMAVAVMCLLTACEQKNKPDDSEPNLENISFEEWPLTDCSTSTSPVRDLVAYKLLNVPYAWEVDWMSGTTYIIAPKFSETETTFTYKEYLDKNLCSGTHGAYTNLINGKTDVIVASRDISRNEKKVFRLFRRYD